MDLERDSSFDWDSSMRSVQSSSAVSATKGVSALLARLVPAAGIIDAVGMLYSTKEGALEKVSGVIDFLRESVESLNGHEPILLPDGTMVSPDGRILMGPPASL